jgi:ribosomal protein S18 acetylase RimI-like enzyme
MKIVPAQRKDMPEVLQLQKLCYLSEAEIYNVYSIPPLTQTLEEIKRGFSRQFFLKAIIDNRIIGSVRAYQKDETCYIGRLIVHPDYQNLGIGTKLMKEIEALFKDAKRFELFTGQRSSKNLHIYQKLGYTSFKTEEINDRLKLLYLQKPQPSFNLENYG